jgi:hypothetical protein
MLVIVGVTLNPKNLQGNTTQNMDPKGHQHMENKPDGNNKCWLSLARVTSMTIFLRVQHHADDIVLDRALTT